MTTQTLASDATEVSSPHKTSHALFHVAGIWPGVLLTALIAAAAYGVRQLPVVGTFSALILAIIIGMAFHNLIGTPARARDGVLFSLRKILRFAIILLGLQLTAQQIAQ